MISFARILVRAAVTKAGARMAWIQREDWSGVCSLGELRDHVPKLRTRSGLISAAFHAPSVQLGRQKTKGGWAIGDAWLVVWTGTRTRYLTKALMDVMTAASRSWPEGFLGDNSPGAFCANCILPSARDEWLACAVPSGSRA